MTREEIDRLWQQALTAATRGGELYARYHFADMLTTVVATDAAKAEREACKRLAQEHAAEYRVGGRLYAPLGENYALCAAAACGHIVHLIEERGKHANQ
jgi:hypothetical protein